MIVLVLRACPVGLRGHLTRWLAEISAGVFVGRVNPRLRDSLWELVVAEAATGGALLVFEDHSVEQGFGYRTHRHEWTPRDVEGMTVLFRPRSAPPSIQQMRTGWSGASRLRKKSH